LLRPPAVPVPAGTAARQHLPALWPHGGVHLLWHCLSAPERLFADEYLLALVGCHLWLARPADRSRARFVAGAADCHLRPRVLCAAAQSDGVTGKKEHLLLRRAVA